MLAAGAVEMRNDEALPVAGRREVKNGHPTPLWCSAKGGTNFGKTAPLSVHSTTLKDTPPAEYLRNISITQPQSLQ
ncbi:hypothetical protein JTE90_005648 [Oedothorax gibbosus]|uniref:Uncharacterized protein n=1 Tax=Oedothorax gibbosus TaxID=931172 RepID=A0AAV6UG91_9ARAC|nr:hypothetical protein JTE90_005648 [Oedothorax gibbosus]